MSPVASPRFRMFQIAAVALLFAAVFAAWSATASAQAPAPPPPAAGAGAEGTMPNPEKSESVLWWIIHTSGFIGLLILILSFYFVATVTKAFFEIRTSVMMPPEVVEECENLINNRDYNGLYKVVKEDTSFFSNVFRAGMVELRGGLGEAREAMDRVIDAEVAEYEKRISMMAVLGTLGPMIGLLGTLKGMIASFSVIARSDAAIKPSEVAGGISEALLLTFEGVILSVPAIYFFAVFRNRINTIAAETGLVADTMIRKLHGGARAGAKPAGEAAPPAATT